MNNPDEYEGGEFDLEIFDPEKKPRYETFKLKKVRQYFFNLMFGIELGRSIQELENP